MLKAPWRGRPLILLGRLGNNRAFWGAYNHSLTAVDGFYPAAMALPCTPPPTSSTTG